MSRWLIASGDFTTLGGMDRANHALARFLADRGDEVHLVAHRVAADLTAHARVTVHRVARPFSAHLVGAPLLARTASAQARSLPSGTRALMNGGNGALGVPTWIHYLHAAYEPDVAVSMRTKLSARAGRRYYLARERTAIDAAPLIICNSERTAADVRRHYNVAPSKIRTVYYGVNPDAFGPTMPGERASARQALGIPAGAAVAIFIGALGDRRKGFDLLFDAWRTLSASRGWDAHLVVAGAGGEREAWAARAAAAGLDDRVRILGFRTDIADVIAAADVLVHPARYEAYGLGVHEAICRGLPAIVSAGAGVAERFPDTFRPLLLPENATAEAVAAALCAWRAEMDEWRRRIVPLSGAWRGRTWDHMAADIAALVGTS